MFSVPLGDEIPQMKALKWRWATEARSLLREARASRRWGEVRDLVSVMI